MCTRIVVMGDSRTGKTEFAYLATRVPVPLNIYKSTDVEHFQLRGAYSVADVAVVPGCADDAMLRAACQGATGVIVLYKNNVTGARRWLNRANATSVPILVCAHASAAPPGRRVREILQHYVTAEHTCTSPLYATGIIDCLNRIVLRARREMPSPLGGAIG